MISVDTTVQEKNITYPTDDKLYKKIIKKCWKIADEEGIDLRQSYRRVVKKLSYQQRFKNTKNGARDARKASKKVKVIAGRLVSKGTGPQAAIESPGHLSEGFEVVSACTFSKAG